MGNAKMTYKSLTRSLVGSVFIGALASLPASAAEITFNWTGQFIVQDYLSGGVWFNSTTGLPQTPVSGTFTFDPANPNLSNMAVDVVPFSFIASGSDTTLTLFSMEEVGYNNLFARFNVNWCDLGGLLGSTDCSGAGSYDMDMGILWDITGLREAIDTTPGGLQVGDILRGDLVIRGGVPIQGINSATPATDGIVFNSQTGEFLNQGPAPMASTTVDATLESRLGFSGFQVLGDDGVGGMLVIGEPGGSLGASINLDIGSGLSMTVTNVIPVPPAAWLFGSGLIGLIGAARRKQA